MDNARVHTARNIQTFLAFIEDRYNFQIMYLPTYSPELNPCEAVFRHTKNYMYSNRNQAHPFWQSIATGFAQVSWHNVLRFYDKCINRYYE